MEPQKIITTFVNTRCLHTTGLTNRWSQPLAVAMRSFDFMKQSSGFATLAAASGGSAPSR
jgi:hypothetical protein